MLTLDFETEAIVGNLIVHPPRPVGLAVTFDDMHSEYITEWEHMWRFWLSAINGKEDLCFHNAPFDLRVGQEAFGTPFPPWERIHDTMYLLYLKDPHADSLSLKPSADRYLDLPPEEQDDLKAWILTHVPQSKASDWGAYICEAPESLVAPYAKGDTLRTRLLFDELRGAVPEEPYNRERELMPYLVQSTLQGIRCNRPHLEATLEAAQAAQGRCEDLIRGKLGQPNLNPHSGPELARALQDSTCIRTDIGWPTTPTGKMSTARDNLIMMIEDPELLNLLVYTGAMQTCIGTFLDPWLRKSEATGRLHPNWNQIRTTHGGKSSKGTRTGRLSSDDPNFQNVPNPFGFDLPEGLVAMPNLREFILPEEGHVWLKRDWSGQEMRILAHFEDGPLAEAYRADPDLDPHGMVKEMIYVMFAKDFPRRFVKETGFGAIYGMGAPGLAQKIGGISVSEAQDLQDGFYAALPGVKELQKGTKRRGRSGQCITTWGGRQYYAETPRVIKGAYRSFEYKLTNYLIQGSAADQAKQCLIDWFKNKPNQDVFMATVHDEINISAPEEEKHRAMSTLKDYMNQDYFDVPMRSEPFMGPNWGSLEVYEE